MIKKEYLMAREKKIIKRQKEKQEGKRRRKI
jgi:hypothetical protein